MNVDDYQLIIVIGLCRSGKTFWSKQLKNHILFDDCMTHFYNGRIVDALMKHHKVCINDPRFCNKAIFDKMMNHLTLIVPIESMLLVLFENNVQQCLLNAKQHPRPGIDKTIQHLSNLYNVNDYTMIQHIVLPVYNSNTTANASLC